MNEKEVDRYKKFNKFLEEFNKESERGTVLLAATYLDEQLKEILESFLIDKKQSREILNNPLSGLGSFHSRVLMSYCLGLIQENEYKKIEIIRKIRNEFAHQWDNISFETQKISNLCNKLPWLGPAWQEKNATLRERFTFNAVVINLDLIWRKDIVKNERRKLKIWPNKMRRFPEDYEKESSNEG